MDTGLKGKVALIAASSEGIGKAAAEAFAAEGARLAICSRNMQKLNAAAEQLHMRYHAEVLPRTVDVRDSNSITAFVDAAVEQFGRIDVLVTNSGGPPAKPFLSLSDEEWKNGVDLCLMSHVYFCRAAIPHMQKQKSGSIIMITSLVVRQPDHALALSSSIRPATLGLVRSLANEFGNDGIRVNAVGPGYTMTSRQEELAKTRAEASGKSPDEIKAGWSADVPLGRTAQPQEIADAILWLGSNRSSYVTGQTIIVDGGKWKGV
jgi:3-oxoacyl-[acyl-carrier protein] reductase